MSRHETIAMEDLKPNTQLYDDSQQNAGISVQVSHKDGSRALISPRDVRETTSDSDFPQTFGDNSAIRQQEDLFKENNSELFPGLKATEQLKDEEWSSKNDGGNGTAYMQKDFSLSVIKSLPGSAY